MNTVAAFSYFGDDPEPSNEGDIVAFSGSVSDVKERLTAMPHDKAVRVIALTMSGATDEQASTLARSFKISGAVLKFLSGDLDADLYSKIIDSIVPKAVPNPTLLIEAQMLATAKAQVIKSGDFLTAKQIAEMAQFSTSNPSSQPNKWKREKLIFTFAHGGIDYFPGYALNADTGYRPYPAVAQILNIFGTRKGGWGAAFWFESPNSFLDGLPPKALLASDPDRVIKAANRAMEPIAHG